MTLNVQNSNVTSCGFIKIKLFVLTGSYTSDGEVETGRWRPVTGDNGVKLQDHRILHFIRSCKIVFRLSQSTQSVINNGYILCFYLKKKGATSSFYVTNIFQFSVVYMLTQGHLVPLDCSALLANDSTCRNHYPRDPWNLSSSVYVFLIVPRRLWLLFQNIIISLAYKGSFYKQYTRKIHTYTGIYFFTFQFLKFCLLVIIANIVEYLNKPDAFFSQIVILGIIWWRNRLFSVRW